MATESRKPKLNIPHTAPPGPKSFDTAPKRVRAWVDGLPMANSGETARLLFGALREVNRLEVDTSERFRFLETFRAPVRTVAQALERHYMGMAFPLPAKNRKVAELGREFQAEMAVGYKRVVADLAAASAFSTMLRRPMLQVAAHRALRYLSQILLKSYQIYAPYPENVWRDIHRLYAFAARERLQGKAIPDEEHVLVKESSLEEAYKAILLLALSGPYRLRQGDVNKVFASLEKWSRHCRLTPVNRSEQEPQGLFAVQPDSDDQPSYLDLSRGHRSGMAWVLDTTGLGSVLREQIARLAKGDEDPVLARELPSDFPPELLRRVMLSWGMMLKRGFSRVPSDGQRVDVVLGLSAIHYHCGGSEQEGLEEAEEGDETELSGATAGPWANLPSRPPQHKVYSCKVLDESAGGYRLLWTGDAGVKAQVGELLGIRSGGGDQWGICVIRWMRSVEDSAMEVGVQMLAPFAHAVAVRVCNARGSCGEHLRSLMLPSLDAIRQPETLVAPGFLYNFASHVMLCMGGEERLVRLTRTVEGTGAFAQFEVTEVERGAEPAGSPLRRRSGERDFDSLWSSL